MEKDINEQKETMKNKISNFFEESSVSATVSAAIPLVGVIIPVVAGVLYIKDRHKILNANTSSAFMNMGNGNF